MLVISLLIYNQKVITKTCIDSILANTVGEYKLILVDNASNRDTALFLQEYAASNPDKIIYHRNDDNLGFMKAHNNVFRLHASDFFCVLNNDVVINEMGWNEKFQDAFTSPQVAIVGPMQRFCFINPQGIGGMRPPHIQQPDYIEGWCLFVKTDIIKANLRDLFDETYLNFAFCEDADLSLRIRQLGYEIKEVPVNIQHMHNHTFKSERLLINFKWHEENNRALLIRRWKHYLKHRVFSLPYKILIKRMNANGDTFCVEPIARELKYKYPGCEIYLETRCPTMLAKSKLFKQMGTGIETQQHFDERIELDLAYELNPQMHIVVAYAKVAHVNLSRISKTPLYDTDLKWTGQNSQTIVVNSEGSWACRMWDINRWKRFITKVKDEGYTIIEVGVGNHLGIGINRTGQLTIHDTALIISQAKEFICFDGGLLHIAQSIGTPSFSIWGCTCPMYRIHDWSICRTVWLDNSIIPCAGCHHWRIAPRYFSECHLDYQYCLEKIEETMVWDAWKNAPYNNPSQEVKRKT